MIIDCHVHLVGSRNWYSKGEWERRCHRRRKALGDKEFERWLTEFDGGYETLIKDMDEAGIEKSVVFPSGSCYYEPNTEVSTWETNEYTVEAQRKYPDRIIGFVRLDFTQPLRETIRLLETGITEWGLKGVKIIPTRPMTDEPCLEVMDIINDLEVPVLFHMGTDPLIWPVENWNPEVLDNFAVRYPKMRMMAAHIARGYDQLLASIMESRENIFADLAILQDECSRSRWYFIMQMRYLMDKIPDQIVMGTDWPMRRGDPPPGLSHKAWFNFFRNLKIPEQILQLGLGIKDFSQDERDKILGGNARRFLGI